MANVVIMTNYAWEQHGIACQMFLQQKRLFIFEITQALLQSNLAWSTFDWKLVKCCWCNVLNGSVAMPAKSLESDSDLLMPSLGANSKSVSWVPGEETFLDNLSLQTIPCCSLSNLPAYVSDARSAAQLPGKFGDVSAGVAAGSTCQLPRLAWQQQEQLLRRRVCKTVQTYSLPREGPEPGDHVCKHLQPNRGRE